jgi:hypothetical protein
MISDEDIWNTVRRLRKERRRQLRRENGLGHRLIKLLLGKRLCRIDDPENALDVGRQDTAQSQPVRPQSSSTGELTDIEEGTVDAESSSEDELVMGTKDDKERLAGSETQSETSAEEGSDDDHVGSLNVLTSGIIETSPENVDEQRGCGDSNDTKNVSY